MSVAESLLAYRAGGRTKLAEEGRCRMCLTPRARRGARMLTRHHVVPRAWFRLRIARAGADLRLHADLDAPAIREEQERLRLVRDSDSNIVPLCVTCHRAVESDEWARRMLRKVLGGGEVALAVGLRGREWFDRRYPPGPTVQSTSRPSQEPRSPIQIRARRPGSRPSWARL